MKTYLIAAALAAFCAAQASAQVATCNSATVPLCTVGNAGAETVIKPLAVPTSTTIVTTFDAYLKVITINNPTSGAIAFSLCDKQSVPVCVPGAASIAANTTYILVWPDGRLYWCPGGFTILAGGAGLTVAGRFNQ